MQRFVGMMLFGVGISTAAMAASPAVPEINPAAGASALTLLAGAILVIRGRRKK